MLDKFKFLMINALTLLNDTPLTPEEQERLESSTEVNTRLYEVSNDKPPEQGL